MRQFCARHTRNANSAISPDSCGIARNMYIVPKGRAYVEVLIITWIANKTLGSLRNPEWKAKKAVQMSHT